ncbi:S8 family serine peptidase [Pedobacter deserti]|uniref:S8 family serine peptidase n=1 Tax=Pedobacter deserti TaxID=2817382 RepID=UPI00210F072F|nr:S8 family serine peptidase [Pedobacter sp. SYSU D00382]
MDAFYWYKGRKVHLTPNPHFEFWLLTSPTISLTSVDAEEHLPQPFEPNRLQLGSLEKSSVLDDSDSNLYWTIVKTSSYKLADPDDVDVIYRGPSFTSENGKLLSLSHIFYVKLKEGADDELLYNMASENGVVIEGRNSFMPEWYAVACTNGTKQNSLVLANLFYESGLFEAAEPDLIEDVRTCANDTYFSQQWALQNTGQSGGTPGADIKMCPAWAVTTGNPSIIVAVVDEGLEFNHPDFTNISATSFDSETGTSPSILYGAHGVACAGIIGATRNNNLGIAGIAPDITLMSISNSLSGSVSSRMKRADAINFARLNGASVINNSWSSDVPYQVIDDAINLATSSGRGGLGCVLTFSVGNTGASFILYPSNLPNVMAVTATNFADFRDIANYGPGLDIGAPGFQIYTTDLVGPAGYNPSPSPAGDYYSAFGGTSAAAPHVAGVAALVLSVNNSLTYSQVASIITGSADKVGGYTYDSNGWSPQLGYGRLNACKALWEALSLTIMGSDQVCTPSTYYIQNLPAAFNVAWSVTPSNIAQLTTSGQGATLGGIANGSVTLTAMVTDLCGSSKTLSKLVQVFAGAPQIEGISIVKSGPSCISSSTQPLSFGLIYNGSSGCNLFSAGITEVQWQVFNFGSGTIQVTNNSGAYACSTPGSAINSGISVTFNIVSSPFMITVIARIKNRCGQWSDYSPGFSFEIRRC